MKRLLAVAGVIGLAAGLTLGLEDHVAEPTAEASSERSSKAARRAPQTHPRPEVESPKRTTPRERTPRQPRELTVGLKGPDVRALQRNLARSTYDPGPSDGSFGYMTQHAVLAFEKVNGLEPDGVVSVREAHLIERSGPPEAPGTGTYIDVDITRQILFEVDDGKVIHTLPVSTANGATYESRSGLATAYTPRGEFQIYSKTSGWRESYLGSLYSPSYFYGGYAIHGSASVPPYPASHGCIRIPMHSAESFFIRNGIGTSVLVHD